MIDGYRTSISNASSAVILSSRIESCWGFVSRSSNRSFSVQILGGPRVSHVLWYSSSSCWDGLWWSNLLAGEFVMYILVLLRSVSIRWFALLVSSGVSLH